MMNSTTKGFGILSWNMNGKHDRNHVYPEVIQEMRAQGYRVGLLQESRITGYEFAAIQAFQDVLAEPEDLLSVSTNISLAHTFSRSHPFGKPKL